MRILYVKEGCPYCAEAVKFLPQESILYIEEDFDLFMYKVYAADSDKAKGHKLPYMIPFDRIPGVPALYDPDLSTMIVGGIVVVSIVSGDKSFDSVFDGMKINCQKCGRRMLFNKSGLCQGCQ